MQPETASESFLPFAQAAAEIARMAGTILRERFGDEHAFDAKTNINDVVSEMDKRSEAIVVGELTRRFPQHAIRAEEGSGPEGDGGALYRWHVDPLDGTTNYLYRIPWFAVSIGLERRDGPPDAHRVVAAAVYDVMHDEMFTAAQGEGAWCNGHRLAVTPVDDLDRALLATGYPYWTKAHPRTLVDNTARVLPRCRDLRRTGAAALDLAGVACGRFEGYFEEGVQSWDTAAGVLLVREAGGLVTDYDGAAVAIPTTHVLATNGKVHDALVGLLRGRYRGGPQAAQA